MLIRRADKKSDDLAGGINLSGIRRNKIPYVEKLIVSVLHVVGVEGGGGRKDHANDNSAMPCDSVVHGARHGEGWGCAALIQVLMHCTAPGNRKIATLVVVAAHDLACR